MTEAVATDTESDSGNRRRLTGLWRWLLPTWATVVLLLCFNQQFTLRFFVGFTMLDTEYYWLLVGLLVPLAFIIYSARRGEHVDRVPAYDVFLFLLTTALALLMVLNARESAASGWEYSAATIAPWWAMWSAVALWILMLEALRRAGGTALFVIMTIFSLYPLFADWVPAPFGSSSVSLLDTAAFHIFSRESVLGVPMRAFAELVIGFLVFGTALQFTGAGTFFINFAFTLCGRYRGGAAKVAIRRFRGRGGRDLAHRTDGPRRCRSPDRPARPLARRRFPHPRRRPATHQRARRARRPPRRQPCRHLRASLASRLRHHVPRGVGPSR